jgi:hypothetical protein
MTYVHDLARKKRIPIIQATRPIILGVAADDIRKASAKNSKCCAFSRAASKEPGVIAAYFFRSTAFLEYADRLVQYGLPPSVRHEIVSFDRSGIMAPGTYQLSKVSPSNTEPQVRARRKATAKATAARKAARKSPRRTPLHEHIQLVQSDRGAPPIPGQPKARIAPKYVRDTAEPKW